MTKSMRSAWVRWCVVGVLTLTACSSREKTRAVDLDRPESAPPATGDAGGAQEPRQGELVRADSAAATAKEQAVAEVWFSYLEEVVRMMSVPDDSPLRLRQLAVTGGVDGPQLYAEDLVERDVRLEGGMVATLREVEVKGNRATVGGCIHSSMLEVDAAGKPLEDLVPWFRATNSLVWDGQSWMVDHHQLERSTQCV